MQWVRSSLQKQAVDPEMLLTVGPKDLAALQRYVLSMDGSRIL